MRVACVCSVVALLVVAVAPQAPLSAVSILGEAGLCGGLASCASPPVPGASKRNCECDPKCRDYADCCEDSPHFSPAAPQAACVSLRQYGLRYMFTSCPRTWTHDGVRELCEQADTPSPDLLASTPVTHRFTGRTFANIFCAVCWDYGADEHLAFWSKRLECPSVQSGIDAGDVVGGVRFDPSLSLWTLNVSGETHHCRMDSAKPDDLDDFSRECGGEMIVSCPSDWNDTATRSMCESYTSTVFDISRRLEYRNPHCAVCNGVPINNITCSIPQGRENRHKFDMQSFAILFDFSKNKGGVGKIQACDDNQLFDPFFKICRSVFCSQGQSYSGENCISDEENDNKPSVAKNDTAYPNCSSNGNTSQGCTESGIHIESCPKFRLSRNDYIINDNGSIYVSKYEKTFEQTEFINKTDGKIYICANNIGEKFIDKFGPFMAYVTIVGLGVSIFFLIIHLVASAFYSELRNLPSKNLASLCVALLCSYIFFIKMTYVQNLGMMCVAMGFLTYYSFMASFAWTLAIGFDIWWTLRLATSQFLVSSGKRNCRFLVYSALSWGAPLMLLAGLVTVDLSPAGVVPDHARPGIGKTSCWFHSRQALLLFFALPFATIMLLNAIFACTSVLIIKSTAAANASSTSRRNVGLYVRLAVITGLTWTVGLAAGYFDVHVLWYVFVALNTLQGLFIFLSFTCSTKMALRLRRSMLAVDRVKTSCWPARASTTLTTQLDTGDDLCSKRRDKSPVPPETNDT